MKTFSKRFTMSLLKQCRPSVASRHLVLVLALSLPLALRAADHGKAYATPEEAVAALAAAVNAQDTNALRVVFGPAAEDLETPDRVQAANELGAFSLALNQTNRLVRESEARYVLELGDSFWPFPVPLVKQDGKWFFDTEAGKEEMLSRRIGQGELMTLRAVRAYVEAQREYAAKDRDGDAVLEFAQKFGSAPGAKDGLYWSPNLDGEISPLGPLVAEAQGEGYGTRPRKEGDAPRPFHGYLFKILTRQAKSAPGGKYDYRVNGNMIGGFALVAWPASYGETGIMTFVVNQQGRVYQKDLGAGTARAVAGMRAYDPDKTWMISPN